MAVYQLWSWFCDECGFHAWEDPFVEQNDAETSFQQHLDGFRCKRVVNPSPSAPRRMDQADEADAWMQAHSDQSDE